MWLSMLTADAAAQHGHEFSAPRPQNQSQTQNAGLRLPFPRTPFSVLPNGFARTTTAGPSAAGPTRTLLPKRSRSLRVTMAELKEVPEEIEEWDEDQIKHLKIPGAFKESHSQLGLEAHFKAGENKGKGKALAVPENVRSMSALDTRSLAASPTPKSPLTRRLPRAKQQFRLAHPPPPAKAKKHLRPRVLLQLQQQATSGFHKPSFEVLPACRFYNDTKVGTKLTKLRNKAQRNGQLNSEDLVVVQIDESKVAGATGEDTDSLEGRTEIGIICAAGSEDGKTAGNAFIYLENSIWKATLNKAGIYDLALQGDEEQKCRWFIPKSKRQRPVSFTGVENLAAASDDKKFYFTTIQPDTTKHPTVAAMTKQSLDVYDSYARAIPNDHSSTPMERTTSSSSSGAADQGEEYFTREEQTPVDDALRRLIIVSSAWLFVREGWSPFFHYSLNTSINLPSTPQSAASFRSLPRSLSTPIDTIKTLEAKSTDRRDSKVSNLVNIPRLVRSATSRSRAQSYRGRSPSGTSSPIPFAGFEPKSTSSSRPASIRQGTSTATPTTLSAPTSTPPSERSPSPSPDSIARQHQVANLEEVLHASQPVLDENRTPEIRSTTPTPPRRTQTPVPDSSAESLEESNTPTQYWQQYDAFMSRNMHKKMFEPAMSSSKNDRVRMDTTPADDQTNETIPMREITARPTAWTTTKNEPTWEDKEADHEFMTRRQRFHNWRHDMWSQMTSVKQPESEVPLNPSITTRELTAPAQVLPELSSGAIDHLPTSAPSRMQSFKADMSARMMRRRTRGRANTIDVDATDEPKIMPEQQIINVTTALDQDVSPLDAAPVLAPTFEPEIVHLTEVESIDPGCGPTGCRSSWHRRLNSVKTSWSRNRGEPSALNESGETSQGQRFDPGFHPRWLRAHR